MEKLINQEIRKIAPEMDPLRMGMGWTAEDLEKPSILIESTFGDSHPGSAHLFRKVQPLLLTVNRRYIFDSHCAQDGNTDQSNRAAALNDHSAVEP